MIAYSLTKSVRKISRGLLELKEVDTSLPAYINFLWRLAVGILLFVVGLYLVKFNFLLVHSLFEIFTVAVGVTIFLIIWNTNKYFDNAFYLILGIAFFFSGIIDTLHLITYKGSGILNLHPDNPANLPTQLWISARFIQSSAFAIAPFYIKKKVAPGYPFWIAVALTTLILLSIFYWQVFPAAYIEDTGLTLFKKLMEAVFIVLFLFGITLITRNKSIIKGKIYDLLVGSLILMIVSELFFSLYVSPSGLINFLGHFVRLVAYYLFYRAIVVLSLDRPYGVMFRNLQASERALMLNERKLKKLIASARHKSRERISILSNINEGIVTVDCNGVIIFANKGFGEIFGLENRRLIDKNIIGLIKLTRKMLGKPETFDIENVIKTVLKTVKSTRFSEVYYARNNKIKSLNITVSPLKTIDKKEGVIFVFDDVTEEASVERMKSEFISFAAHQLRTPLSTLSLAVEGISRKLRFDFPRKKFPHMNDISRETNYMRRIVDSLLDLSRVETGNYKIKPEPVSIEAVIDESIENNLPQIIKKKITIDRTKRKNLPPIETDREALETIIDNILGNSIKYLGKNGTIKIEKTFSRKYLTITIADNGQGISKKDQKDIFFRIKRGESSESERGFGIGLYLVYQLIKSVKGEISYESPIPEKSRWLKGNPGTVFFIKLPIKNQFMKY